jgi:hypothetical protein
VLKANAFFYGITGGILAFYFSHSDIKLVKYSLLLPTVMSVVFAFIFGYGAIGLLTIRDDIFQLRDDLGFKTAPTAHILTVSLWIFSFMLCCVAIAMIVLMTQR